MTTYTHIPKDKIEWTKSELGVETARLQGSGVIMSMVKGTKGSQTKEHTHSIGSYIYVVSGKMEVDGAILNAGDAGYCRGGGQYGQRFLEDSLYVVCRSDKDEITTG